MSRITFLQGANLLMEGVIQGFGGGYLAYNVSHKILVWYRGPISPDAKTTAEKIKNFDPEEIGVIVATFIIIARIALTVTTLASHIYYKTNPDEASTKKLMRQAAKIFLHLQTLQSSQK